MDNYHDKGDEHGYGDERVVYDEKLSSSNFDIDPPSIGCFYRFRKELSCSYGFFSLDELNGTVLDVKNTFAPGPKLWCVLVLGRLLLVAAAIFAMVYSIVNYPAENRPYWMGFLTHWTVVVTIAYLAIILAVTLSPKALAQPANGKPPTVLVRLAWAFYSLALPMNVLVVLLYWTLDYTPGQTINFSTISLHGATCFLVLIDGNLLSRIPIRMKHIALVEAVAVLLVIWTVLNDLVGIGDGKWDGEDADQNNADDKLYSVLNWSDDPGKAAVISVIVIFVVNPIIFVLCWMLSIWSRWLTKCDGSRRYIYQEGGGDKQVEDPHRNADYFVGDDDDDDDDDDIEEGVSAE